MRFRIGIFLLLLLAMSGAAPASETRPRNIILIIGDGMGFGQVAMARLTDSAQTLKMDSMEVAGLLQVTPAIGVIPDSAAAATALATGYRTTNGRIGQLADSSPVSTILELAEARGNATGLVTNTSITHATPASFAAHVPQRGMEWEIASQMLESGVDVLLGGGRSFFIPRTTPGSRRRDGRDLLKEARASGFEVVQTRKKMLSTDAHRLLGLFALRGMTTDPPEPSLSEMALKALEILSADPDGFFLMVEGGQIDWECHDHDAAGALKQMREFDAMIGEVLAVSRERGDTLVVVTADHETGGLTLTKPRSGFTRWPFRVNWSTPGHSAADVPLLADGPSAMRFTGVLESRQVPLRIAEVWGLSGFEAVDE